MHYLTFFADFARALAFMIGLGSAAGWAITSLSRKPKEWTKEMPPERPRHWVFARGWVYDDEEPGAEWEPPRPLDWQEEERKDRPWE